MKVSKTENEWYESVLVFKGFQGRIEKLVQKVLHC